MTPIADAVDVVTESERPRRLRWDLILVTGMVVAFAISAVQLGRSAWQRLQPEFKPSVTIVLSHPVAAEATAEVLTVPEWSPLARAGPRSLETVVESADDEPLVQETMPVAGELDDRAKRWNIRFDAELTPVEYAQRLDALGIELGIPAGGGKIDYVSALASATPQRRQGSVSEESRLYLTWDSGGLPQADAEFLAKVGIMQQEVVLHFVPAALEEQMAALEIAFASNAPAAIVETEFGIRPRAEGGFELYVVAQHVRGQDSAAGN